MSSFPSEHALDVVFAFDKSPKTPERDEISRKFLASEIGAYEFQSLASDYLKGEPGHSSDCALHNGPAQKPESCNCGLNPKMTPRVYGSEFPA